ncbi:MAG: undecaprenyl-diphosphate phosphatase [Desulfovibrio sp.]|jgi:undecaprenyl-diphosphatase|nr:undecaprenyl-diphosphate phosphatase [Desulfovibrio sp.]
MDNLFTALVLSIVEGVTEFLPVSSSGHLILAGNILNFTGERAATFDVVIQLGAILAVVVLYRKRFLWLALPGKREAGARFAGLRGIGLLVLTSLPACMLGLALHSSIKHYLFRPLTVLIALVIGAVCMIIVERRKYDVVCDNLDGITPRLALGIGCFQCLALWPGFSRSAATIMGGMMLGTGRALAAEYSFIAAVPIMIAATGYDMLKSLSLFSAADIPFFLTGLAGAFVSALLAVKIFVALLGRTSLIPFAVYRLLIAPFVYYFMI